MKEFLIKHSPDFLIRKLANPKTVVMEATNSCMLKCVGCPTPVHKRARGFMTLHTFNTILSKLPDSIEDINFNWSGEPLMNKDIFHMTTNAQNLGYRTHITTNGMLIDTFSPTELIMTELDSMAICLDGTTKKVHEEYRRGSDFTRIVKNIKFMNQFRQNNETKLILQTLMWKKNNDKNKLILLGKRLGVDEIHFRNFCVSMRNESQSFLPENNIYNSDLTPKLPYNICYGFKVPVILYNGDVTTCCQDWEGDNVFGNLLKSDWSTVWKNNPIKKTINKQYALCKACRLSKDLNADKVILRK